MGAQGYGAHGQWGAGVWDTCMGNEVQGYGAHGQWVQGYGAHRQWGTGAMGHIGNGAQSAVGTGGMDTWTIGHID